MGLFEDVHASFLRLAAQGTLLCCVWGSWCATTTKVGGIVAFIEDERGNIVLTKAELKRV
ncbi:hypothetical protein [[Eubacterium] cellulosolvens]